MKKLLLFAFVVLFSMASIGQSAGTNEIFKKSYEKKIASDDPVEAPFYYKKPNHMAASNVNKSAYDEEILGNTYYGLQTNSSVQNRIMRDENGNMSVVWTASTAKDNVWNDRGTGYSYYDGSAWTLSGDYPRIETVRCGWPNILYPSSGGEVIISHQSIISGSSTITLLKFNSRPTKGSGNWTEKSVSTTGLTWPRAVIGGPDGNSIHLIAVTDEEDSLKFQGLRRALVYYRSTDGGSTFDIQDSILPGLDKTQVGPMSGDSYAMFAKGDTIIIGVFDTWNDVFMMKSVDNGDTWTKTIAYHNSLAKIDLAKDTFSTPTYVPDGSGAVMMGNDGKIHLFWSYIQAWNDALETPVTYNYVGDTDGLLYWNSDKPADDIDTIAKVVDYDQNGLVGLSGTWPNYGLGLTSLPSPALADDGTIYLAYAGIHEVFNDLEAPAHNFRHTYIIKSEDNGDSWTAPLDINPYEEHSENIYASMYPKVTDEYIHMVFQRDSDPGNATTDGYPVTNNEIIYAKVNISLNVGDEILTENIGSPLVFPNPAKNRVTVDYSLKKPSMVNISIIHITGQKSMELPQQSGLAGHNKLQIDVRELPAGIYFVNIQPSEGKSSTHKLIIE